MVLESAAREAGPCQWQEVKGGKDLSHSSRAPEASKQKCVVNTVSSLLCNARMEQSEKFLIPGIMEACAITVYNMQTIPFNQKFPYKENLKLYIGHWSISIFFYLF